METIDIHGEKVKIEHGSESAKYGTEYLNELSKDEAEVFFDAAKRNTTSNSSHFETPHNGEHNNISHHLTLVHNDDGTYTLRKRTGY